MPIVKYGNRHIADISMKAELRGLGDDRNYFRRRADHCQHRNHCSVTQRPEMQIGSTGPAPGYAPGKEYYDWGQNNSLGKIF